MDIKRAIKILKGRDKFVADINLDAKIAYKMAIEALEAQQRLIEFSEIEDVGAEIPKED